LTISSSFPSCTHTYPRCSPSARMSA